MLHPLCHLSLLRLVECLKLLKISRYNLAGRILQLKFTALYILVFQPPFLLRTGMFYFRLIVQPRVNVTKIGNSFNFFSEVQPIVKVTKVGNRQLNSCSVVGCTFASVYSKDLVRHMRTHTGKREFRNDVTPPGGIHKC